MSYKPIFMYYLPVNYYDPIGYYSDEYQLNYYNGYGYNFYYGEYKYYEKSLNLEAHSGEDPSWVGWLVSGIFAFWVLCISLNLSNLKKMREKMRLEEEAKKAAKDVEK